MVTFQTLHSIPAGSMMMVTDQPQLDAYIDAFTQLPKDLLPVVADVKIGAYLRGLVRTYNLPVEKSAYVAQVVLEVITGMIATAEMTRTLTQRLGVDVKVGENIAREIEKELLAPVALELNQYLQSKATAKISNAIRQPADQMPNKNTEAASQLRPPGSQTSPRLRPTSTGQVPLNNGDKDDLAL